MSAPADISKDGKIGFFDSGLGGFTILEATARVLPEYDYVFYGDTEHLPLGDKTEEEIYQYTKTGVEELFKQGCQLVIIACNTASSETLRRLQDTFLQEIYPDRRILGVVIPTVEALIDSGKSSALLIATRRTVESDKYELELRQRSTRAIKFSSVATPKLVPLIEEGKGEEAGNLATETIKKAMSELGPFEVIILGCTHYTRVKEVLRNVFSASSDKPLILSQDEIIPAKITDYLNRHPEMTARLHQEKGGVGKRSIILTTHRPDYDQIAGELFKDIVQNPC